MQEKTARIYVAGSIYDKPLQDSYTFINEEVFLQVGAALTAKRMSPDAVLDCDGENISKRNKQFCELTGLYWIWKNASEDYVGLVHYRRHFLLPDNWLERMSENKVDVILPVPLYVAPSIAGNYKERHIASDWEYMMSYFKDNIPEEYEAADRIFSGNLYSPCNMLIAGKESDQPAGGCKLRGGGDVGADGGGGSCHEKNCACPGRVYCDLRDGNDRTFPADVSAGSRP